MGIKTAPGFTIIEVMLFLAVTGLMIAGVLVNATSSINAQQYRDGVEATRNTIAGQYSAVYSMQIYSLTREGTASERNDLNIDPCPWLDGDEVTVNRGTSDCFYSGRLVQILPSSSGQTTASTLRITPVVADPLLTGDRLFENQQSAAGEANAATINPDTGLPYTLSERYRFARYDGDGQLVEEKSLDWGLTAVTPGTDDPMELSLLILRSPVDGTVQTYNLLAGDRDASTINYENLGPLLDATSFASAKFCLADLSGSLDPGDRTAITIQRGATNSGDVDARLITEDGAPQC